MASVTLPDPICTFDGECPGVVPGVTLAELAATQAAWYRSWGTEAGDLFAHQMASLAADIRACSGHDEAISVAEFKGRFQALRDELAFAQAVDAFESDPVEREF